MQCGRPRADRCVDACSQDQAGVLCHGGRGWREGQSGRERERDEWREGGKKRREGGVDFFVLFKLDNWRRTSPGLERSKCSWNKKNEGGKVRRREAATIQALASSHTVSSGKDKEFWIRKKLLGSLPLLVFRRTSYCSFCVVETFPSFPPTIHFCFFWNKKLIRWPLTSNAHTHTAFPNPY